MSTVMVFGMESQRDDIRLCLQGERISVETIEKKVKRPSCYQGEEWEEHPQECCGLCQSLEFTGGKSESQTLLTTNIHFLRCIRDLRSQSHEYNGAEDNFLGTEEVMCFLSSLRGQQTWLRRHLQVL